MYKSQRVKFLRRKRDTRKDKKINLRREIQEEIEKEMQGERDSRREIEKVMQGERYKEIQSLRERYIYIKGEI